MTPLTIMRALAATPKRTEKEQIIFDAFMKGERNWFACAQFALDPLITFGVQRVPRIVEPDDTPSTFQITDFWELLAKLRRRELTGHAARDAIADAAMRCQFEEWNEVYRPVLLKDMNVGVEAKTINKVLKKIMGAEPEAEKFIIPVFGCQLAFDGADPKHAKKLAGDKYLDVKFDGVRLLTTLDKATGTVAQFTRDGRLNENFSQITTAFYHMMADLPHSVVLDGEIISTSFQDLMTQVNRDENVDTSNTRLALFDMIPLADFRRGYCATSQEERHKALSALATSGLLAEHTGRSVFVTPKVRVNLDTPEGQEAFSQFNKEALDAGYEGIMVKDPAAPYEGKKWHAWLKVKPFIEVSLAITGFEQADDDTKYAGYLGAFICEGEDDGKMIKTKVGSGLTDEQRKDLWERREELLGLIVEIRADAMTMARGSNVYSLRFPRFKGFRGKLPGQKI